MADQTQITRDILRAMGEKLVQIADTATEHELLITARACQQQGRLAEVELIEHMPSEAEAAAAH